jgi:hypothetical protein
MRPWSISEKGEGEKRAIREIHPTIFKFVIVLVDVRSLWTSTASQHTRGSGELTSRTGICLVSRRADRKKHRRLTKSLDRQGTSRDEPHIGAMARVS